MCIGLHSGQVTFGCWLGKIIVELESVSLCTFGLCSEIMMSGSLLCRWYVRSEC